MSAILGIDMDNMEGMALNFMGATGPLSCRRPGAEGGDPYWLGTPAFQLTWCDAHVLEIFSNAGVCGSCSGC
jgi:hypothetical protein